MTQHSLPVSDRSDRNMPLRRPESALNADLPHRVVAVDPPLGYRPPMPIPRPFGLYRPGPNAMSPRTSLVRCRP